jgi:hypothetical protein
MFSYPLPPVVPSEFERRWYGLRNTLYNRFVSR